MISLLRTRISKPSHHLRPSPPPPSATPSLVRTIVLHNFSPPSPPPFSNPPPLRSNQMDHTMPSDSRFPFPYLPTTHPPRPHTPPPDTCDTPPCPFLSLLSAPWGDRVFDGSKATNKKINDTHPTPPPSSPSPSHLPSHFLDGQANFPPPPTTPSSPPPFYPPSSWSMKVGGETEGLGGWLEANESCAGWFFPATTVSFLPTTHPPPPPHVCANPFSPAWVERHRRFTHA